MSIGKEWRENSSISMSKDTKSKGYQMLDIGFDGSFYSKIPPNDEIINVLDIMIVVTIILYS